jgi:hypothetical protein
VPRHGVPHAPRRHCDPFDEVGPCDEFDYYAPLCPLQCSDGLGACVLSADSTTVDVQFQVTYHAELSDVAWVELKLARAGGDELRVARQSVRGDRTQATFTLLDLALDALYLVELTGTAPYCEVSSPLGPESGEVENWYFEATFTPCGRYRAWLWPKGAPAPDSADPGCPAIPCPDGAFPGGA